jgi:Tat protein secretion system quality control protein TatD with DNase activity
MSAHLVDIGINLAHRLFDRDRAAVIERAAAAGVTTMVVTPAAAARSITTARSRSNDRCARLIPMSTR